MVDWARVQGMGILLIVVGVTMVVLGILSMTLALLYILWLLF